MGTKSCSNKKLIKLNVQQYDHVDQAIVSGEAKGSACRKVLNKIDQKKCFWSNAEINNVSESFGVVIGSVPVILVVAVATIVDNALLLPLKRVVKNRKCNKDEDGASEPDGDDYNEWNAEDVVDDRDEDAADCDDATRTIDFGEDDCSEDDCSEDDYVCKKKKKNPFSTLWNKIAKRK